jgi:hypothetical protein
MKIEYWSLGCDVLGGPKDRAVKIATAQMPEIAKDIAAAMNLEPVSEDGWQPIDTSPRDGDVFMAYVPHGAGGFQFVAVWNTADRLLCMMSGDDFTGKATLWHPVIPLPA